MIRNYFIDKPTTIKNSQTVRDVIHLFTKRHFNSAIVVDKQDNIVGTISLHDIAEAIVPPGILDNPTLGNSLYKEGFFEKLCQEVGDKKIGDYMRKDYITATQDTHILEILGQFISKDLYLVPIMEDDKIIGIITRSNLKRAIALAMDLVHEEELD